MAKALRRSRIKIWCDVIFALLVRHVGSKFDDKFGMAWAVIEPLLFILMLSFLRGRMGGEESHGMPVFVFIMFGMLMLRAFTDVLSDAASALRKNKSLFAFRQVQPISSVIASAIFNVIIDIFVFSLILLFMYLMKIEFQISDMLTILLLYAQLIMMGISFGLLFGIASTFVRELDKIRSLITRPLMFISCVFFSLQDIPEELWPYFTWNPLLHCIELSRQAAYPNFGAVGVDYSYVSIITICVLFLALACYRLTWKEVLSR
ncbi:ABC transporter permease [Neiella marina]|uniref:Transport permease protein n=1 Tax=Neiella holothuriorum TaxID=2870530 RepID=A0ABS7EGD8_9GAMM|nr:ABC transporter permease [Neiella holothuriorum]MBW8190762.1 ABC transporter permease [Neiella holothuriorum]